MIKELQTIEQVRIGFLKRLATYDDRMVFTLLKLESSAELNELLALAPEHAPTVVPQLKKMLRMMDTLQARLNEALGI